MFLRAKTTTLKFIFTMGLDGHVGGGIGHAG